MFHHVSLTEQGRELPACFPLLHRQAARADYPEVTGALRRKALGQIHTSVSPTLLAALYCRYVLRVCIVIIFTTVLFFFF